MQKKLTVRTQSSESPQNSRIRSTTVLCVRRNGQVVMAGDGQVTLDKTVMKATARKVRRLAEGSVLAGFAGATADAYDRAHPRARR